MKQQMFIPEKINVGFQNRKGTYTGKLAYVTYYDNKNILRKELSWNSWRDQTIPNQELKNENIHGFVLNKGVGGTRESYGWNPRNEYIRVYDPRDFEFEISVANLLFILQETSSIKGKGLEGEFIYAWDGKELVLLPVSSQEYKKCKEYTQLQDEKVTKKDIVEGHTYLTKNQQNVMYLGKFDWYDSTYGDHCYYPHCKKKKYHVFVDLDYDKEKSYGHKYWLQTGFTKLAKKTSSDSNTLFAQEYDELVNSAYVSSVVSLQCEKINIDIKAELGVPYRSSFSIHMEDGGKIYSVSVHKHEEEFYIMKLAYYEINNNILERHVVKSLNYFNRPEDADRKHLTAQQIKDIAVRAYAVCENGAEFQLH